MGAPAWMRAASLAGMPTSRVITCAIASLRSRRAAAMRRTAAMRSASGVCDHCAKAARAERTARSTSERDAVR